MKRSLPSKINISPRKSFLCAANGLVTAYLRERNFRCHTGVALIVFYVGFRFSLSPAEWVGLILTVAVVLASELLNAAIEHAIDYLSQGGHHPLAGAAKDIAAGATLLSSIAAVSVGIVLFWRPQQLADLLRDIASRPLGPALVVAAAFLVVFLPDQVRKFKER